MVEKNVENKIGKNQKVDGRIGAKEALQSKTKIEGIAKIVKKTSKVKDIGYYRTSVDKYFVEIYKHNAEISAPGYKPGLYDKREKVHERLMATIKDASERGIADYELYKTAANKYIDLGWLEYVPEVVKYAEKVGIGIKKETYELLKNSLEKDISELYERSDEEIYYNHSSGESSLMQRLHDSNLFDKWSSGICGVFGDIADTLRIVLETGVKDKELCMHALSACIAAYREHEIKRKAFPWVVKEHGSGVSILRNIEEVIVTAVKAGAKPKITRGLADSINEYSLSHIEKGGSEWKKYYSKMI